MKKLLYSLPFLSTILAVTGLIVSSCVQEELVEEVKADEPTFAIVGEPVDAYLDITVGGLTVNASTRSEDGLGEEDDTELERKVNDLWVFQYDASTETLVSNPFYVNYIEIAADNQEILRNIPVTLSDNNNEPSIVYVVTNTGDPNWVTYDSGTSTYPGFATLAEVETAAIPTPTYQKLIFDYTNETYVGYNDSDISIPMAGYDETVVQDGKVVTVDVQRMYAKLCIRVNLDNFNNSAYSSVWVDNVTVSSIPYYSRVTTLWPGSSSTAAADYDDCPMWLSTTFAADEDSEYKSEKTIYPYVIYVPENIQGETEVKSVDKALNIPEAVKTSSSTDALSVTVQIKTLTIGGATVGPYAFTAYPGGNDSNNFNVRRNCVYYLTMEIDDVSDDPIESANCIVCMAGAETTFYPYERPEEGGGYKISTYLDYDYETGAESKRIASVEILWQSENSTGTGGYIGDNAHADPKLVWIDDAPEVSVYLADMSYVERRRKIHVTVPAGELGNAVIVARNSDECGSDIIWSWHIWTPEKDPSDLSNGIEYMTYDWDSDGIKYESNRIPGYTVMNSNIGALYTTPQTGVTSGSTALDMSTFGTLYQWGRKDPFPSGSVYSNSTTGYQLYNESYTARYYGDDNEQVGMTSGTQTASGELFYSLPGNQREEVIGTDPLKYIQYSIAHPSVFLCGTLLAADSSNSSTTLQNRYAGGNNYCVEDTQYILQNHYPEPYDANWLYDSSSDHCNRLWGGLDPEHDSISKKLLLTDENGEPLTDGSGNEVHMYDDYGTEKSIFDPCPYGWRVSPPDLWLGFTYTGGNPRSTQQLNDVNYRSFEYRDGFYMYMTAWKDGDVSFFPVQGTRGPQGCVVRAGECGNYHNATADVSDRVNILHLHNGYNWFHIFELSIPQYYFKSTAGPVRCVNMESVTASN